MKLEVEVNLLELTPTLETILSDSGVFDNLLTDGVIVEDVLDSLREESCLIQIAVDHQFAGFFSVEDMGTFCDRRVAQVHAYIMPSHRRYSLMLLREFRNWLFSNTSFSTIVTQTTSYLPYIDRVLRLVGFKQFDTRHATHQYNGVKYDSHYHYIQNGG